MYRQSDEGQKNKISFKSWTVNETIGSTIQQLSWRSYTGDWSKHSRFLYDELLNHDSLKNEIDFLFVLFE